MAHDWLGDLFRRWGWEAARGRGRRVRLAIETLDQRVNPTVTYQGVSLAPQMADGRARFEPPAGTVFRTTEVVAVVNAADPVGSLAAAAAAEGYVGIDASKSFAILPTDGGQLVQVGLTAGTNPLSAVRWLESLTNVRWADPNYGLSYDARDYTPNDPRLSEQYSIDLIGLRQAWDTTKGISSVIVGVTDDGVGINHPDLQGSIWVNSKETPGNGVDDDGNGFADDVNGWDFFQGDNDPNPNGTSTHGTHVSGTIAARTNNGQGIAGNAGGDGTAGSGVRVMPLRWDGSNGDGSKAFSPTTIAAAFRYGADNGAKIINSSYNFDGFTDLNGVVNPIIIAAFDYSYGKGVLHLLSAGNNGELDPPRRSLTYPLFVAATDSNDVRASFSNYGRYVDISAPGVDVLSSVVGNSGTTFDYEFFSGTSMSTPNTAGVAALIWSAHPTWTREQVAAQLVATADAAALYAANPGQPFQLGTGRVNAFRAVTETAADIGPPRFTADTLPAEGKTIANSPASFILDAPYRFDPATVTKTAFELREAGADGLFDTTDDEIIPIVRDGLRPYRVGDSQLVFAIPALGTGRYRFTAFGAQLKDPFNQFLDGNGDGVAGDGTGVSGDNFQRTFSVRIASTVAGAVFEDFDRAGRPTASAVGVPGATVYLDKNSNGKFDLGETSVVTDFGGRYRFTGLSSGTAARIGLILPVGWSLADGLGNPRTVTVPASASLNGVNFGLVRDSGLYVRVFQDSDLDGLFDPGEPGLAGATITLDTNNNGVYDAPSASSNTVTTVTNKTPVGLPDLKITNAPLDVTGLAGPIRSVTVQLNITHNNVTDLSGTVIAPDGTRIPLFFEVGGFFGGQDFSNTVFDDTALTSIDSPFAFAPYSGRYRPMGRGLADLAGKPANGRWQLELSDGLLGDSGVLNYWSITFTTVAGDQQVTPGADGTVRLDAPLGSSNVILTRRQGLKLTTKRADLVTTPTTYSIPQTVGAGAVPPVQFGLVRDIAPPRFVSIRPTGLEITNKSAVTYNVTFSEPIENLTAAAFTLTFDGFGGGVPTLGTIVQGANANTYVLTVNTPGGFGTLDVTVKDGILYDYALNLAIQLPGSSTRVTVDTIAPTSVLGIAANQPVFSSGTWPGEITGTAADAETAIDQVLVSIRQDGTGLWYDGTSFSSASKVELQATLGVNGAWSYPISAGSLPEGPYTVFERAKDLAGNFQEEVNDASFGIDNGPPSLTITPTAGQFVNAGPIEFDLVFSEPVYAAVGADFLTTLSNSLVVSNGKVRSVTGSGTRFFAYVDPNGTGVVTLDLPAGSLADFAGNGTLAASGNIQFDDIAPAVTAGAGQDGAAYQPAAWVGRISGTASDVGSGLVFVRVAVRKASTDQFFDFATGKYERATPDYAFAAGTTDWSFDFNTFDGDDSYQFLVEGVDFASNKSVRPLTVTIDGAAPTPAVVTPAASALVNATGFEQGGLRLTGTGADATSGAALTQVSVLRESDGRYFDGIGFGATAATFVAAGGTAANWSLPALTAALLTDGRFTVTVRTTDRAGNVGEAMSRFTYDNTSPVPVLAVPADGSGYNSRGWSGVLSGRVSDTLDTKLPDGVKLAFQRASDGAYWNGSFFAPAANNLPTFLTATVQQTSAGTTWSYPFPVSGFSADGRYLLTVQATDKAGNTQTTTGSFSYDNTSPTSTVTPLGANDTFSPASFPGAISGTATDAVGGATQGGASGVAGVRVSVRQVATGKYFDGVGFNAFSDTRLPAVLALPGGRDTGWTLAIPASALPADGRYEVAAYAADVAGNEQPFGTPYPFGFDATPPVSTVTAGQGAVTNVSPLTFTVRFDTAVGDLDPAGLLVTNGSVLGVDRLSDRAFTVRVNPVADGPVALSVLSTAARDAAGNPTAPSGPAIGQFDRTSPTLTLTAPAGVVPLGQPVTVTATFSEPVTGFTLASLQPTNATVLGLTGSGASYSIQLLPSGPGPVGLTVAGGNFRDTAGNAGTAAVSVNRSSEDPRYAASVGSVVRSYDGTNALRGQASPFGSDYRGSIRVASGDFNGDGIPDTVAGTAPGGPTNVVILDGRTNSVLFQINPFEEAFAGGVYVAAGDITGDGVPELVITPDEGGGPRVRVFNGATFAEIVDFFGIADSGFRGGARATIGDINGDGTGDLVVAAGFGGGPRVAIFDGTTITRGAANIQRVVGDFFAYEQTLRNGVFVAAGDLDGDGKAELVVSGGPGGGPRVTVLSGAALSAGAITPTADFFSGDPNSRDGVRVAVKRTDPTAPSQLIVGGGSTTRLAVYPASSLTQSNPTPSFDQVMLPGDTNGVFVG